MPEVAEPLLAERDFPASGGLRNGVIAQYAEIAQGKTGAIHPGTCAGLEGTTEGKSSSGKWEGDTLVVETTGFRDDQWLDISGTPASDVMRITERFRRVNYGNLEIELTIDDPKTYTKPWTVKLHQTLKLDTDLLDYMCLENEKDFKHLK